MEDYIYEQDYTKPQTTADDQFMEMFEQVKQFCVRLDGHMRTIPRVVDPQQKAVFDRLLQLCDEYAKGHGGKISAHIDYRVYDAYISLTLSCLEIVAPEDMALFQAMAAAASITFQPTKGGKQNIRLDFDYFIPLHPSGEDLVAERFDTDPELKELYDACPWPDQEIS